MPYMTRIPNRAMPRKLETMNPNATTETKTDFIAMLDAVIAERIAELDHNSLVELAETKLGVDLAKAVNAELAKRGLTYFLPTEQV